MWASTNIFCHQQRPSTADYSCWQGGVVERIQSTAECVESYLWITETYKGTAELYPSPHCHVQEEK